MSVVLRQREPSIELPKLRNSAKGKHCTLRSEWCRNRTETVVWCHSNFQEHGKGVGKKAHDIFGFYGCFECHTWFDTICKQEEVPSDERRLLFYRAMSESLPIALREGAIR